MVNMNYLRSNICNIEIDNIQMVDVFKASERFLTDGNNHYIVTPNVDHIVKLQTDVEFRAIYKNADLVLADGMPLIWASIFLGAPLKEKISGSDLFPELCAWCARKGYRPFFLGGRPGAAQRSAEILKAEIPDLEVAGCYAPPYGFHKIPRQNDRTINIIRRAEPDILFVGLGTPKQEKWMVSQIKELNVPLSIGIGASFDFKAGMVKRAPLWMQKNGLEWFWRLLMEPGRMWRRYLVDDMNFFSLVLKQKFKKN
jgi:exopolysaccharide biosynthesis WecB/TagA/CpsF family protein